MTMLYPILCYNEVCYKGKGLTSWLSFVMSNCEVVTFPLVSWVRVWCFILSIPNLCLFSYLCYKRTTVLAFRNYPCLKK